MDDYIAKPVDRARLHAILAEVAQAERASTTRRTAIAWICNCCGTKSVPTVRPKW